MFGSFQDICTATRLGSMTIKNDGTDIYYYNNNL